MLASESTQGIAFHSCFDFGFGVFVLELDTLYETPSDQSVWFILCAYGPTYCYPVLSVGLTSVPLYLSSHRSISLYKILCLLEDSERRAFEDDPNTFPLYIA
jgi:hypothetical protein